MGSFSKRQPGSAESARTRAPSSGHSRSSSAGPGPAAFSISRGQGSGKGISRSFAKTLPSIGRAAVLLVDTSVWIELFRKPASIQLDAVAEFDDVVTCLPVVQEVLQGFRDERAFQLAREAMHALPIVESPLTRGVVDDAVGLYRAGRRAGITIRSGVDCLIAACAIRHGLELLHHDRDYDALARISPLRVRRLSLKKTATSK